MFGECDEEEVGRDRWNLEVERKREKKKLKERHKFRFTNVMAAKQFKKLILTAAVSMI